MAMGMRYDEFWEGDPQLAMVYRKAHKLKQDMANEQAWLQGLYVYAAFGTVLENAFRRRGAKVKNYLEKPIDIYPLTDAEKKKREAEEWAKIDAQMREMQRRQYKSNQKRGGA